MRTLIGTLVGILFLGMLGLGEAEAVNIRVREVSRERQREGLLVVYELRNASVDRWDLRRVELHVFDRNDRRLDLLRPLTRLGRLEREDVDFIRARIPSTTLQEAHRLEIRIFVEEVLGYPVADPIPKRLVYPFPLRPQTIPAVLWVREGMLQAEPVGIVQSSGRPRALLLRLINPGHETLFGVVLMGEISGTHGPSQRLQIPVAPKHFPPGAEAYVSIPVPTPMVNRVKEISFQAFYRKADDKETVTYGEELKIRGKASRPESGWSLRSVEWGPY